MIQNGQHHRARRPLASPRPQGRAHPLRDLDTKAAAKSWAEKIERQVDELRASGVMQARGLTLGDLIDRYIREIYPLKPWGRTKSADLARLKEDLGHLRADALAASHFTEHFTRRYAEGAGAVVISSQPKS